MSENIKALLNGANVRSVLLKESRKVIEIQPGDSIKVGSEKAIVKDVLFQDVFLGDKYLKASADVEFHDENGKYRHWQSWSDGGVLITNDGLTYRFEKES